MTQMSWRDRVDATRPILVTGAAGFVGFHLAARLLAEGFAVLGTDSLNAYYDPALKEARLTRLRQYPAFSFAKADLSDRDAMREVFDAAKPRYVIHLAAQAGVRYSLENPHAYADANLSGFLNILEECRRVEPAHLIFASSSSVYGGNLKAPFATSDPVDHPVSLYAATKKANELMAHTYAHIHGLPVTGLRFFTVYGPWGRPDMAYFLFTKALFEGQPIRVNNKGEMWRDFTYIDDIVEGITRLIPHVPIPDPDFDRMAPDPARSWAPYRVFNIGNSAREKLADMISILEELTGREAVKDFQPMPPGDVLSTWADVTGLEDAVGFAPRTPLREGLKHFVDWYREFYRV